MMKIIDDVQITLHSLELIVQTRMEWSLEQDAKIVPSGCTRTMRTHSLWPVNDLTQ